MIDFDGAKASVAAIISMISAREGTPYAIGCEKEMRTILFTLDAAKKEIARLNEPITDEDMRFAADEGLRVMFMESEIARLTTVHDNATVWIADAQAEIARLTALNEQKDRAMKRLAHYGDGDCTMCFYPDYPIEARIAAAMEAAGEEGE